jgi:hypothetical protein
MDLNEILERHANKASKLTLRLLKPDEFERSGSVLIEGDAGSLKFLADLLQFYASQMSEGKIQLHPNGAGRKHFSAESDLGLYINLRP